MNLPGRAQVLWRLRSGASVLAAAAAFSGAIGHQAWAAQVQAYLMFELSASADVNAATEMLRSTSLGNCLQLVIGSHSRDVLLHLACDEPENEADVSYLNQAVMDLARVDGVARATIFSLRHGTD